MGRYSSDHWGCLGLVPLAVAFWLVLEHGTAGLAILAFMCFCAFVIVGVIQQANEAERRRKPCDHGTQGASLVPSLCAQCIVRHEAARAEDQRARELLAVERRKAQQKAFDDWKERARTPEYLRSMDPREFEVLVCELFRRMGFEATVTAYSGDGGVDGFLRRTGRLSLLQCKRVKGSVGEPVLRDLFGSMHAHDADEGIVVTTGSVSRQALSWAEGKPIRIIELEELTGLIQNHLDGSAVVPANFEIPPSIVDSKFCPECQQPLRTIRGRKGRFLGCSGYPGCRYTKSLPRRR